MFAIAFMGSKGGPASGLFVTGSVSSRSTTASITVESLSPRKIKALLQDPDQVRAVDEDALFSLFVFYPRRRPPATLFAGIHKLPPGSFFLTIDASGLQRVERYLGCS